MRYNFVSLAYRKGSGKWKSSKIFIQKRDLFKIQQKNFNMCDGKWVISFHIFLCRSRTKSIVLTQAQDTTQWKKIENTTKYYKPDKTHQQHIGKNNFIMELYWGFVLLLEFKSFDSIQFFSALVPFEIARKRTRSITFRFYCLFSGYLILF